MSITTFAALAPIIDYLRPTKSPYLMMVIFGIMALTKTADLFFGKEEWLMMLIPQFIALIIFTVFSYYGREVEINGESINDQLGFSRAITIATAVMCLVIGASSVTGTGALFNIVYTTCLTQLFVFLVYTAARLIKEESSLDFNFFQFAVITSALLVGATYSAVNIDISDSNYFINTVSPNDQGRSEHVDLFAINSVLLYLLWGFCIRFWIKRVLNTIQLKVVDNA